MRRSHYAMSALALLVIACSDDDGGKPVPEPTADAVTPTPSSSATPDDAGSVEARPIPLIDWVDDLLDHHTNDVSLPDTVADKKIVDDENPSIFDRRF